MQYAANGFVVLLAFLQSYFMILEMFFWTKPKGLKIFGNTLMLNPPLFYAMDSLPKMKRFLINSNYFLLAVFLLLEFMVVLPLVKKYFLFRRRRS
jgi:hypothetical protein